MIIIGAFEYSLEIELLLAGLENNHISRKYIMVIPMDISANNPFQFNCKKKEIHYKSIEVGMAFATGSSVIGTSVGFILEWGPVFWGLIAAAIGFAIGSGISLSLNKYKKYKRDLDKLPDLTVIVQCQEEQVGFVIDTMWKHYALSVGKYIK